MSGYDAPWCVVAELTGLSLEAASALLEQADGDVQMAVTLHFDPGGGRFVQRVQQRSRDFLDEDLQVQAAPTTKKEGNAFAALFGNDSDSDVSDDGGGPAGDGNEAEPPQQPSSARPAAARLAAVLGDHDDDDDDDDDAADAFAGDDDDDDDDDYDEDSAEDNPDYESDRDSDENGDGGGGGGDATATMSVQRGGISSSSSGPVDVNDRHRELVDEMERLHVAATDALDGDPDPGKGKGKGPDDDADDDTDDDTDDDDWLDDDEPWEPIWEESLFDGKVSATLEQNLDYMWEAHGFFVPNRARLADAMGLFGYLQEKVYRYNSCLNCHRCFHSLEAVRGHMRDKSHMMVNYEDGDGALELDRFYGDTAPAAAPARGDGDGDGDGDGGGAAAAGAAPAPSDTSADGASTASGPRAGTVSTNVRRHPTPFLSQSGELVLPSGSRIGHRSFKQFYKQSFGNRAALVTTRGAGSAKHLRGKVALREANKARNGVLVKSAAFAKGNSKALASNFVFKADFADNERRRAIIHHWGAGGGGSHMSMAGSRQYQKGVRVKGLRLKGATLQNSNRSQKSLNKMNRASAARTTR